MGESMNHQCHHKNRQLWGDHGLQRVLGARADVLVSACQAEGSVGSLHTRHGKLPHTPVATRSSSGTATATQKRRKTQKQKVYKQQATSTLPNSLKSSGGKQYLLEDNGISFSCNTESHIVEKSTTIRWRARCITFN